MERPELVFASLEVGRRYGDRRVPVSAELTEAYCRAIGTDNPVYRPDARAQRLFQGPIAPPSLPVIFTPPRVGIPEWRIPPGAIHTAQEWESLRPVRPGDVLRVQIVLSEKVAREERRDVVFDTLVLDTRSEPVARGRMTLRWPR